MCEAKVLKLCSMHCSSPMSASTGSYTASRAPAAGTCRPQAAIRCSSPTVLSDTVLPPVFGPVITIACDPPAGISMSMGTTSPSSRGCRASFSWNPASGAMLGSTASCASA